LRPIVNLQQARSDLNIGTSVSWWLVHGEIEQRLAFPSVANADRMESYE